MVHVAKNVLYIKGLLDPGTTLLEFDSPTRTVSDAANTIGCEEGQIAKSLVFRSFSGQPVLVVVCGTNRVDERKVSVLLDEEVVRATPDFVRQKSGFPIGGVPPIGHKVKPIILLDQDLTLFDEIWAAAGTPFAVFRLTPTYLRQLTGAEYVDVAEEC